MLLCVWGGGGVGECCYLVCAARALRVMFCWNGVGFDCLWLDRYYVARRAWEDLGGKVIDATVGGRCTVFERSLEWRQQVQKLL